MPLTLSEIWIYPVKSLGGAPLERASVLTKGLRFDRRWMLVDRSGEAMTQRVYPHMARFQVSLNANHLLVSFQTPEKLIDAIEIDTTIPESAATFTADVWGDKVRVTETDPAISRWFSRHLGTSCRFVAFPEGNSRPVDPKFSNGDEQVSLADAFPFLLISRASLDDLNAKLRTPVPMNRFRPNFVITGGHPFQEDAWQRFTIGGIAFKGVKRSARCTLITVDQQSGTKGDEPLRTLSAYRKEGHSVYFGQNLIALERGEVKRGDALILS